MPSPGNPGGGWGGAAGFGEAALAVAGKVALGLLGAVLLTGDSQQVPPAPQPPQRDPRLKLTPGLAGLGAAGAVAGTALHPPVQQGPHVSPLHPAGRQTGTGTTAPATKPHLPGLEGLVPTAGTLPGNAGIPVQSPVKPVNVYEAQAYTNLTAAQRHFRSLLDGGDTPAGQ